MQSDCEMHGWPQTVADRLTLGVNSFHDDRDGEGVRARHAIIVFHSACTLTDRAPPRLAAFGQNIPYHFILSKSLSLFPVEDDGGRPSLSHLMYIMA